MRDDPRRRLTNKIIQLMESGSAPWQLAFDGAERLPPFNPVKNFNFRGANALALATEGRDDPRWVSLSDIQQYGWQVKAGESPFIVEAWTFTKRVDPQFGPDGPAQSYLHVLDRPQVGYVPLFNGSQLQDMPALAMGVETRRAEGIILAQRILEHAPLNLVLNDDQRFFYRGSKDEAHLARHDGSADQGDYLLRALSVAAYATAHPRRLNRYGNAGVSTNQTAAEELRVQLARVLLAQRLGLPFRPQPRSTFIGKWASLLERDPGELFSAVRDAEQMTEYLLAYSRERQLGVVHESDIRNPTILSEPEKAFLRQQRFVDMPVKLEQGPGAWNDVVRPLFSKGLIYPDPVEGGFWLSGAGIRARQVAQQQSQQLSQGQRNSADERTWLNVPFPDLVEMKAVGGARWDRERKSWYLPPGYDSSKFEKWLGMPRELTASEIRGQFLHALEDAGLVVDGEPIMDGQRHYTTVSTSSKRKALKGAYVGHLEGVDVPHGYIWNFDQGISVPWRATGLILSVEQRAQFQDQLEQNRRQRDNESTAAYEAVAKSARAQWDKMGEPNNHPYLERKGVLAYGLRQQGRNLVTPVRDIDGKIWSLQLIDGQPGGAKLFMKGGMKTGNFHVLGDLDTAEFVLFSEGYATSASLKMAAPAPERTAVVETFDSGNIAAVVKALKPKLVGKTGLICGDDDFLTSEYVLSSVNKQLASDLAVKRLGTTVVLDALHLDGVERRVADGVSMSLRIQANEDGVERVTGRVWNDTTKQTHSIQVSNQGREKAIAAAAEHDIGVTFPVFQSLDGRPTDYNDLHQREGLARVSEQLGAALNALDRGAAKRTAAEIVRTTLGETASLSEALADGRYMGTVLGNTVSHAVQGVGRSKAVTHQLTNLDRIPEVGQATRIVYKEGKGIVGNVTNRMRGGRDE